MKRFWGLWLLTLVLLSVRVSAEAEASATPTNLPPIIDPAKKVFHTEPAGDDGNIAMFTAIILSKVQYRLQPFNLEISEQFFDRYLDSLDPAHILFLQSDVQEFSRYRDQLHHKILLSGDTSPAHEIFERFIQRIDQQVALVKSQLQTNTFVFKGDETFELDRKKEPRPANLQAAHQLWRERLRFEYLQEKLNQEKPEEIVKKISRRYTNTQRILKEFDGNDVLQYFLNALARVYDPHSEYMGRSVAENFKINMQLSLIGIGAQLQSEDGYCKIRELVAGGPAERSKKLRVNDRIIAVAQGDEEPVDILDMKLDKAVALIRGKKGTEVRLTIIPANAADPSVRRVIPLIRDEIKLDDGEAKAKIIDVPGASKLRLGVIDLPSFYASFDEKSTPKSCTADVARLLEKLKREKVDGIILDLRRNGGGSLDEAIRLTGLFIPSGPVVQVRDPRGTIMVESDRDPAVQYDGPLMVLTSRFSASASEILAGALQDYDRALIVGDKATHGKGTVQQLMQLEPQMKRQGLVLTNNPGELKFTIRMFFRPSGASTQLKGVVPDLVLPSLNNYAELGEESLPGALPYDTIASAKFEKSNLASRFLQDLKKLSDARLATDPDFVYLAGEIERFKKSLQEKAISLNEERRAKERDEAKARQEARKQILKARPESTEKVYEIPLKLAEQEGLPAPLSKTNLSASAKSANSLKAAATADIGPDHGKVKIHEAKVATVNTNREQVADNSKSGKVKSGDFDDDDVADDDDVPEVDFAMNEAKRILGDWIGLIKQNPAAGVLAGSETIK
jgi:carboxyl-terminal processing protease